MYANIAKTGQRVDTSEQINVRVLPNPHLSEYVYYECQKINLTQADEDCVYEENRRAPIVNKPSDYKFCIQRLEASLVDIPMFNQADKTLEVTMTYPPDNLSAPVTITIPSGLDIYNVNQVVSYINEALQTAFLNLQGLYNAIYGPGAWSSNPLLSVAPFGVRYIETEDRLVVYSDLRNAFGLPNASYLEFNSEMQELFRGNTYFINPSNRLLFNDGFGNSNRVLLPDGVLYLDNVASYSTSALWYSIKQIVVISNRLGARLVQVGTPGLAGNANTRSIILDFNYIPDNGPNSPGTRLQYLAQNNRWTDMTTDTPLTSIDFQLYYRNKNERLIPVRLRPGESFSLLCLFAKTVTN